MDREKELIEACQKAGFERNEEGKIPVPPEIVPFSEKLWEALAETKTNPFEALPALIPLFIQQQEEHYRKDTDALPSWKKIAKKLEGEWDGEFVRSFLEERLCLSERTEDWLMAPVRLNIGMTVDSYREYTLNVTYPAYSWAEYEWDNRGHFQYSSIMWLTRRQGYKQADLREAQHLVKEAANAKDPLTVISSPYLYSAAMEIWHELSIFNQLGFFIQLPLWQLLLLVTMQRWGEARKKWPGYILLDKKTRCGFFSTDDGSCSLLGIQLEKEVKIPLKDVDLYPDAAIGYSQIDVHEDPEVWQLDCIRHIGFPRQFRRDAASLGVPPEFLQAARQLH